MSFIHRQQQGEAVVLRLGLGQLTATTAHQIFAEIRGSVGDARVLVIDMSRVEFLDSSGIGELVLLGKRSSASGVAFCVAGLRPNLMALIKMMRLETIMTFSPDVDTGLSTLAQARQGDG